MKKLIIAVDIDDVLAAEAEFVIKYSNAEWGHELTLDDYTEHWAFWGYEHTHPEFERRAAKLHEPGIVSKYRIIPGSMDVLKKLSRQYELIIVTSRRRRVEEETRQWLNMHFPGVFSEVVLTGFWDEVQRADRHLLSKGSLLKDKQVSYVIDDQPKHCLSAAEHGIKAVLYGDYAESRGIDLPKGVVRCKDWREVGEYFGI
ncbi:hypothetical protein KDA14_01085 [Candidatus Saccharibacteria bacterium]|nr:hypothetical protein [Candidatus Saccharibacteria bacterium]